VLLLTACTPAPRPDVLLVSLDTTRADALSCYGGGDGTTPNLDRLAAAGVRFAWALASAPSTLSSHATVFTGLDPHQHRVVRNGWPMRAALETLAGRMAAAGWDTLGVAGASVLDPASGISRGFRTFDVDFDARVNKRYEARADEVTDRALAVKPEPGRPTFRFVHYFDAHAPYDAPAPFGRRFADPAYAGPVDGSRRALQALVRRVQAREADPADVAEVEARYRGEVAFVDHELGRLFTTIDLTKTVVVVFGDHGELLGEEKVRPFGHGGDVDLAAIHVPLIVHAPGLAPAVVDRPVRLQDVGTTVLRLAGLGGSMGEGVDLLAGGATPALFAEATQPTGIQRTDAWPNLPMERAIVKDGWMLVRPLERTPDVLRRVGEERMQAMDGRGRALAAELDAWDAAAPRVTVVEPAQKDALEALGYVDE
jgi:arylsulfatase A-like enzyme